MLRIVRTEIVDEKNVVVCLVLMFPSWVMVLKLSKNYIFCNSVQTSARKSIKATHIYICTSERSCYALSENNMVYGQMMWFRDKILLT